MRVLQNKKLSFSDQIKILYLFKGILFTIGGTLLLIPSKISQWIGCIILLLALFSIVKTFFYEKENTDEMSTANLNDAKAKVLTVSQIIILFLSVVYTMILSPVLHIEINITENMSHIAVLFIGLIDFATGILFAKLEE